MAYLTDYEKANIEHLFNNNTAYSYHKLKQRVEYLLSKNKKKPLKVVIKKLNFDKSNIKMLYTFNMLLDTLDKHE